MLSIVIACNMLIGGTDRIDQIHSRFSSLTKERKVSLKILMFYLDMRIHDTYFLLKLSLKAKRASNFCKENQKEN